jgi:predicted esterase
VLDLDESHPLVQHQSSQTFASLSQFIRESLVSSKENFMNRWPMDRIFVIGFGQGGTMALGLNGMKGLEELGGCISISGWPLPRPFEFMVPCLLTYGSLEPIPKEKMSKLEKTKNLELFCVPGKDQSMPKDSTEMHQIMKFLGSKLALRNLKLESQADVYEIK